MLSIDEELRAVKNFLCENNKFIPTEMDNVLFIESEMEYLSLLVNSGGFGKGYLLKKEGNSFIEKCFILDYLNIYSYSIKDLLIDAIEPNKNKYVLFYNDPIKLSGYSTKNYERKKRNELFNSLFEDVKKIFPHFPINFIIIPRFYYSNSNKYEFTEGIYHYIVGTILKKEGYIVANECQLKLPINGIPDLVAISTTEKFGYFLSDIEYLFEKKKSMFKNLINLLKEPFVIEIKRPDSFKLAENQLNRYLDYENISNGFVFAFNLDLKSMKEKKSIGFNIITLFPNGSYEIIRLSHNEHTYDNEFFKFGIEKAYIKGSSLSKIINIFSESTFYKNENILHNKIDQLFI